MASKFSILASCIFSRASDSLFTKPWISSMLGSGFIISCPSMIATFSRSALRSTIFKRRSMRISLIFALCSSESFISFWLDAFSFSFSRAALS